MSRLDCGFFLNIIEEIVYCYDIMLPNHITLIVSIIVVTSKRFYVFSVLLIRCLKAPQSNYDNRASDLQLSR